MKEPEPIRCPNCGNRVLTKSDDGLALRPHGAVQFESGVCKLRCYFCKSHLELPVVLKKSTAEDATSARRIFIRSDLAAEKKAAQG